MLNKKNKNCIKKYLFSCEKQFVNKKVINKAYLLQSKIVFFHLLGSKIHEIKKELYERVCDRSKELNLPIFLQYELHSQIIFSFSILIFEIHYILMTRVSLIFRSEIILLSFR